MEKTFKVGDKIIKKGWYGKHTYEVVRVTKTQAIIKVNDKYEEKFRIKYKVEDMGNGHKWFRVTPIPRIEWNTTTYEVIEK